MKTFVQKFIEDNYFECGQSVLVIVKPDENQNLPQHLVERNKPTLLIIQSNRPVNIEFLDDYMLVDLCFDGPPQRVQLDWDDIYFIGTDIEEMKLCTVITSLVRSVNDHSIIGDVQVPLDVWNVPVDVKQSESEKSSAKPKLSVVK
jgi:hypothetical protein